MTYHIYYIINTCHTYYQNFMTKIYNLSCDYNIKSNMSY